MYIRVLSKLFNILSHSWFHTKFHIFELSQMAKKLYRLRLKDRFCECGNYMETIRRTENGIEFVCQKCGKIKEIYVRQR